MTDDNGNDDIAGKPPGKPPKRGTGGYRQPPTAYRYPPGHSGNPKGRPRGSKNKPVPITDWRCDDIVLEEAFRPVKAQENGRLVELPIYRVLIRNMATQGASGEVRSAKNFHYAVSDAIRRRKALNDEWRNAAAEHIAAAKIEIQMREAKGLPIDDIQPHPDDVRWDTETAMPYFIDPASEPTLVENRKQLKLVKELIRKQEKFSAKARTADEIASDRDALHKLRTYRDMLIAKIKRQERQKGS